MKAANNPPHKRTGKPRRFCIDFDTYTSCLKESCRSLLECTFGNLFHKL